MGALRVVLSCGNADVFADEQIGGDPGDAYDRNRATLFSYTHEVIGNRSLAITVTQWLKDRRVSSTFEPIGSVQVAVYAPAEWKSVVRD